jgi:hypothetical protein
MERSIALSDARLVKDVLLAMLRRTPTVKKNL